MTTAQEQMKMFETARKEGVKNSYSEFIKKMHKDRFNLVEKLRYEGKLDCDWHIVEEFDKEIEKQEGIFSSAYGDTK